MEDRPMSSVLFDAPGPRARARHRVYTAISALVILGLVYLAFRQLDRRGQFAYDLWEPFVTPRIINVLLVGVGQTVLAAVIAIAASVCFGAIFGVGKLSDHRVLRWPSWLVVEFFRAVPLLMLIIVTWYWLGAKTGAMAFWSLVIGLTLYNGAVLAEVFRAGINALPKGQSEAAYAIGLRKSQVMQLILIPQAVKIMLPAIINQAVTALKDTTLGYAITAPGVVYAAKPVYQEFRNILQTAIVLALVFVIVNLILARIATYLQRRFGGESKIDLVGGIVQSQPGAGAAVGGPGL
jgi:glutamate transport system permease protein